MNKNLENIIEAILFVSGDGIEREAIFNKLEVSEEEFNAAIYNLQQKYDKPSGINLINYENKLQICSNSDYAVEVAKVLNPIKERRLSKAMLEVIAIIAYKQPVTRLDVENIRGVNSDYAIQTLIKHNLIEVVGRKDTIGKPMLFGTTDEFLKRFELTSLEKLPNYEDLLESIAIINEPEQDTLYDEFEVEEDEVEEDKSLDVIKNNVEAEVNIKEENLTDSNTELVPENFETDTLEYEEGFEFKEEEIPDFLKEEDDLERVEDSIKDTLAKLNAVNKAVGN